MYTPKMVAAKLKVNYRTILREIERGKLKAGKVGRIMLVSSKSLEEYINGVSIQPLKISVAIVEKDDQVLLVKRRMKEGNLLWQFPAGRVRYGEKTASRAEIECLKESGIHCIAIRKFGMRIHPDTGAEVHYWLCGYLSGEIYNAETVENSDVVWVPKRKTVELFTSDFYEPVRRYLVKQ